MFDEIRYKRKFNNKSMNIDDIDFDDINLSMNVILEIWSCDIFLKGYDRHEYEFLSHKPKFHS